MSLDYVVKPLDPSLYFLDPKLEKLFKTSTGIQDDEELKAHILKVQDEAYRVRYKIVFSSVDTLISSTTSLFHILAFGSSLLQGVPYWLLPRKSLMNCIYAQTCSP